MSGAVDEDVVRTVNSGRETLGAMLSTAQKHLQKVFILFVVGLIGTIWVLRNFVWRQLQRDLNANPNIEVVAITPFDVILLQVKIGLVVGILVALPLLIYYSRDALIERGVWPKNIPRWQLAGILGASTLLFVAGVAYSYFLFFPLMFNFLAGNAVQSGFVPTYSIVKWAQFIFLLGVSFGLAAQLPLLMSGLSYTRIVPYQTFREKWKYAVLGIFVFGALFSPPDPFTQIMWAVPLLVLYGISLGLSKFITTARDAGDLVGVRNTFRAHWNVVLGVGFVAGVAAYGVTTTLLGGALDATLSSYGLTLARDALFGLPVQQGAIVVAAAVGLVGGFAVLLRYLFRALDAIAATDPDAVDFAVLDADGVQAVPTRAFREMEEEEALAHASAAMEAGDDEKAQVILDRFDAVQAATSEGDTASEGDAATADTDGPAPASAGDPGAIDLSTLDAGGIRAAPVEAFADMTEDEALELASEAMEAGDDEKAQAVLDRFDAVPEMVEAGAVENGATAAAANGATDAEGTAADEDDGSVFTRTGAGMLSAFTEDDVDEDDIGGYAYDIAFILESLTSKTFRIVGLFMLVLASTFFVLYNGGIKVLKESFLRKLPDAIVADQVQIVTLHPVEALIFEIKVSTIIAAVATLPLLLYYAWPALKERGFARGDRNVLFTWAGGVFLGLVAGSAFGFLYVAPGIISWLAADVVNANMVIAYQVNNFGWLVFFTTVGVGLLVDIPVAMFLFHRGGLITYEQMRGRWREVTVTILAVVALASPRGVFMMFILGIPILLFYALGLGILHAYTLGGRRGGGGSRKQVVN